MVGPYPKDPRFMAGGVEAVVYQLAHALASRPDITLRLINVQPNCAHRVEVIDRFQLETLGYRFFKPFPAFACELLFGLTHFRRDVERIMDEFRPDIVHTHCTGIISNMTLQTASPHVLTVHGLIDQEKKAWRGWQMRVRGLILGFIERRVLKRADHAIAVSPYVAHYLRSRSNAECRMIFNPIDQRFLDTDPDMLRINPGTGTTATADTILVVASLAPRKGIHHLIDAVAQLIRDGIAVRLSIVGAVVEPDYFQELSRQVKDRQIEAYVSFRGALDIDELMREYHSCSLFVLPSAEESLGLVLLEAMAAGKPVIASRVGGIPDIVTDGQNGVLVAYGDPSALASAIKTVLTDTKLQSRMGANGRAYVMATFSPAAIADATVDYYQTILDRSGE